ncbi:small GTP-binding protein [Tritrichomonas foetus]|uniref:Small GTP-binding protein n=1 Tax=Tritrichomonas foetus TaxID=1144522 RepID=A0A1J4K9X7_9EUKA|nr:small GTP-binding protein [Tritrichomonas foetus]|eukprot:OHT07762.1 small GTP-binding protein [Tritrichomonas foetus]
MPLLEFKVVIIGSVAVGKTALVNRIQYNQFEEEYQATIGAGYVPYRTSCEGKDVELQIWDTAGMERYKSLGPIYYRDAVGAIIVYDQTDQDSANAVKRWLEAFRATVKTPATIIIVGNKDDLENKIVPSEPMRQWAEENGFDFVLTSAKSGKNVSELFSNLVQKLVKSQSVNVESIQSNEKLNVGQKQDEGRPKDACC